MVDIHKASAILNELEVEYLRLGSTLCHNLNDETQLSAFFASWLAVNSFAESHADADTTFDGDGRV